MANRVESFSIRKSRVEENKLIDWYRAHSISVGPDFSSLVLAALKQYKDHLEKAK